VHRIRIYLILIHIVPDLNHELLWIRNHYHSVYEIFRYPSVCEHQQILGIDS
tara:strand:- start:222 stop:377 length:156 start_codon:yes stop_codon:yes gene_type:complete